MSRNKVFKVILVFLLIVTAIITGTVALTISDTTSVNDLIDATSTEDWYDFTPGDVMGNKIEVNADNSKKGGYCIDPETKISKGTKYEIVNVIDINNASNTVKVYSIEDPEGTEYNLSDDNVQPLLMLAYLTMKADENPTDLTVHGYKDTLNRIFNTKSWIEKLKEVGLSNSFQTALNSDNYLSAKKVQEKLNEAQRYAETMASQGSIETATLAVNMTDEEKQSVSITVDGDKTYIGPYKLSLNNSCTIGSITINGDTEAAGISTDLSTTKTVDNITDSKEFYIVLDEKIEEINSIKVTAEESISSIKSRMVLVGNSPSQNFLVWRSEETTVIPEVTLEVPKYGKLQIEKQDEFENSDLNLEDIGFVLWSENQKAYVTTDNNGKISYVDFATAKKNEFKTDSDGKTVEIENLPLGKYKIYETSIPEVLQDYYELPSATLNDKGGKTVTTNAKLITVDNSKTVEVKTGQTVSVSAINKRDFTSFYIIKRDEDTRELLDGMEFKIYKQNDGWVAFDSSSNNKVTSVKESFEDASTLITVNGNTPTITRLPVGKYTIVETGLGNNTEYKLGKFELNGATLDGHIVEQKELKANETGVTYIDVTNKQAFINISGVVWEDVKTGKNLKEFNNKLGEEDYRVNNIEVKLIDKTNGKVVASTKTAYDAATKQNGFYRFKQVEIEKLKDYYIEFTYDGVTYQSVITPSDVTDEKVTSKASENARKELNDKFTELTGEGQNLAGVTLGYNKTKASSGNNSIVTSKNIGEKSLSENVVTINKVGDFTTTSITADSYLLTTYNTLKGTDGKTKVKEITNVNLGIFEREQPNLALIKDIHSADVSINGKTYVYSYGQKESEVETSIGVAFQDKNIFNEKYKYNIPIYKADSAYENEDKSKELQVAITYKVGLVNNSNNLYAKVNSIKEMYSEGLELTKMYTLDENGKETVLYNAATQNNNYNVNIQIAPNKVEYVYVKFKLPKDSFYNTIEKTLYADKEFINIAEISSYTIYGDDYKNTYAGFDTSSIPNNFNINNQDATDEDDSDFAPGLKIKDAGERTISGIVFEDSDKDQNDNARIGDGQFTDGENKVAHVKVQLVDAQGNIAKLYNSETKAFTEMAIETNEQGEYQIKGFIPGDYTVQYTWGEGENTTINNNPVTVDKYKSTIWTEANRKQKEQAKWYLETTPRYSDALDNYEQRKELDKSTNNLNTNLNSNTSNATMTSTTSNVEIGIELKDYEEALVNDKIVYTFDVENVDFGLIERPIQSIELQKNVSALKIKNADEVFVDATINDQGQLEGQTKGVTGGPAFKYVKVEMDKDVTVGATAEVAYKVNVKNTSEKDYDSEEYYLYGIEDETKLITQNVEGIYDYIRGLVPTIESNNKQWQVVPALQIQQTIPETTIDKLVNTANAENENITIQLPALTENITSMIEDWLEEMARQRKPFSDIKFADATVSKSNDNEVSLKAGEEKNMTFYSDVILRSDNDLVFENDTEIGNVIRTSQTGRSLSLDKSNLYAKAERITITPPTGEDKDYTPIIIISTTAIAVLGLGIVIIKKRVLK